MMAKRMIINVVAGVACAGLIHDSARGYEIPRRRIEITPYLNIVAPHDLLQDWRGRNLVKDDPGPGFGVKIHNQVYGSFGFIIDFSFTDLEVTNNSLSTAAMFTGGGYYARETGIGDFSLNIGYGVLSVAGYAHALFLPGIEYDRRLSARFGISAGIDWVLPNDWFYEESVDTDYGTFSFYLGCGFVF